MQKEKGDKQSYLPVLVNGIESENAQLPVLALVMQR
jgi:hypothetical protein